MNPITPGKYLTRCGEVAYVLAVLDTTYDQIVGYMIGKGDDYTYPMAMTWERDGAKYSFPDEYDLVERIEE